MKQLILFLLASVATISGYAADKIVKITAVPQETAIYVNNNLAGYGYAEFTKPKRNEVAVIKLECAEYTTVITKFYGTDKRTAISYTLQQDGFYRSSAASGIVNKYFTFFLSFVYLYLIYYLNYHPHLNLEYFLHNFL